MGSNKGKCKVCFGRVCAPILAVMAVMAGVCVAVAIVLAALGPHEINSMAKDKLTLEPGHATYEQLKDPTLPVWKSISFFNLTNPEGFAKGEAPNVTELGPYSYRESRVKQFLDVTDNGTILVYNQSKTFTFDPSASGPGLQENDTICTINIPLVAAVAQFEGLDKFLKLLGKKHMQAIFSETHSEVFMCVEAGHLAWNFTTDLVQRLHTDIELKALHLNYPRDWVSIQQNASINDTRPSRIHTGVGQLDLIGQYVEWDGQEKLSIWPGPTANDINGTEGLFFRPLQHKGETLQAFVDDVVRSFVLEYTHTVKHKGLEAYRYEIPLDQYKSAFDEPSNARWGSWCPDGLFYVGVIQYPTVPVFGSKPHFLDGDPILRQKVIGLHPDRSLHETTIDVEPVTGANIQFKKQLQINVQVNQTSDFDQVKNINGTLYYPVFYVNEHAELTDAFKSYLEDKGLKEYQLASELLWVVFAILLFAGIVLSVIAFVGWGKCLAYLRPRAQQSTGSGERTPLLTPEDT